MEKIAFTTNLDKGQLERLRLISKRIRIPQSVLIRDWIDKGINQILSSKNFASNEEFIVKQAVIKGALNRREIYKSLRASEDGR